MEILKKLFTRRAPVVIQTEPMVTGGRYVDPAIIAERALGLFQQAMENTDTALKVLSEQKQKAIEEVSALNQRIIDNDAQIGKLSGARAKIAELLGE